LSKKVIHIYGASGSGTSTFGRYISDKLGYKFMDTDDYYWAKSEVPYSVKNSVEKRLELMKRDIQKAENVVISGGLAGWGDELKSFFTTVIRLKTDTAIRMERLKKREKQRFKERIEIGGDMYEHHLEFMDWAASYDTGGPDMRSKLKHDIWQETIDCTHIVLDGSDSLEENFDKIKDYI